MKISSEEIDIFNRHFDALNLECVTSLTKNTNKNIAEELS